MITGSAKGRELICMSSITMTQARIQPAMISGRLRPSGVLIRSDTQPESTGKNRPVIPVVDIIIPVAKFEPVSSFR